MSPSESELGWLAGVIDGEGSINATKAKNGRVVNVQVNIAGSDWRMIEKVKLLINRITGFHVAAYRVGAKLNNDCWMVRVTKKALLRALLPSVLRHLVLKRAQAALLLAMCERSWDNRGAPGWVDDFGRRIQALNRHRIGPDGKWYKSGYQKTREYRGKPHTGEPVETIQATASAEDIVPPT